MERELWRNLKEEGGNENDRSITNKNVGRLARLHCWVGTRFIELYVAFKHICILLSYRCVCRCVLERFDPIDLTRRPA